jgi:hypothetical protein
VVLDLELAGHGRGGQDGGGVGVRPSPLSDWRVARSVIGGRAVGCPSGAKIAATRDLTGRSGRSGRRPQMARMQLRRSILPAMVVALRVTL